MKLGIDCGGTKTEAVVLDKNKVIFQLKYNRASNKKNVIAIIKDIISRKYKINKIGVGFAAPLVNGLASEIVNIKDWTGININEYIKNEFNIKCVAENDANCFTLAEARLGKGNKKYKTVVGITLGTGLGCGVVVNGKVFSGINGTIGEIGKIPFKNKTLENFTSKKFFLENYNDEPLQIFKRARDGNKKDIKIVREYSKNLGKMLSIVCAMWNPECIVFGGSISKSFDMFNNDMMTELSNHIFKAQLNSLTVKQGEIKYSGAVGAALL